MGKGDVKSKKGKRWRASFGNSRPARFPKKITASISKPVDEKAAKVKEVSSETIAEPKPKVPRVPKAKA